MPSANSRLPSGDVRLAALSHPDDLAWPPTSGNAFSARVLDQILPLPESEDPTGADMFLHALTPLFGPVIALDRVGGSYRLHERNSHLRPEVDLARSRWVLGKAQATHRAMSEVAQGLGYQVPSPRSITLLGHRVLSLRAGDGGHPLPGDNRRAIMRDVLQALETRSELTTRRRALYFTWFVLVSVAPRRLLPRLAEAALGLGRPTRSSP